MHTSKTKSLRMKNLFFVAVALGIFSGTSNKVTAQTSVHLETLASKAKVNPSPKFIEDIEIAPEKISNNISADNAMESVTASPAVVSLNHNTFASSSIEQCSSMQFKYATLMDAPVETITNAPLYNFIDQWWGTRYHYGGDDKYGIDCSAFTGRVIANVYGINLPRTAADQYKASERVTKENLQEGDLVFFNTRGGVSHAGVYLGNNYFVHSSVKYGVTISSMEDGYYSKKFISGGRVNKDVVKTN